MRIVPFVIVTALAVNLSLAANALPESVTTPKGDENPEMITKNGIRPHANLPPAQAIKWCRFCVLNDCRWPDDNNEALRGITNVRVELKQVIDDNKWFPTDADLRTAIELRCRTVGLNVEDKGFSSLIVGCGGKGIPDAGGELLVRVRLVEPVIIMRNFQTIVYKDLWNEEKIITLERNQVTPAGVEQVVNRVLDGFLNDWLKYNPKRE